MWDGESDLSGMVVSGGEGFLRPLQAAPIAAAEAAQTKGHASILLDFVDAVDSGRRPETDATDNVMSLSMVFSAIESARRGERVPIPTYGAS